ncbi:late embryogenesis abundant domain-containing protein / LEA domain-containing protein [Raphanus sativus]|nr:late embryogenesis abundant domain-containing protein / LEA domain-containing protein [Raphanus sativus]
MDTIRAAEERYNKAKESMSHGGQEGRGEGRGSGVHATHVTTERGPHGGGEATAVLGQEGPGRVGVELTGGGREELESGAHGFHGEKARHAQLLAAGGEEIKERRDQESAGGGGRSRTDYMGHEHGDR